MLAASEVLHKNVELVECCHPKPPLHDLSRDSYRHRPCVECRCQSKRIEIAQCAAQAESPRLDARIFLDVGCGLEQRAVEIQIRRGGQQPVSPVTREWRNQLPV